MSVVVCGSLAYDNLMEFDGKFGDYILPDQIHILSVAFNVPRLRKEFGGCAGNIAYNLKLLGIEPIITATVGQDFDSYGSWLEKNDISKDAIQIIDNMYTAQCFITTDSNNNQLTSFHPGAMDEGHKNPISLTDNIEMAIIAPDGKQSTIEHAEQLHEQSIPIMYDPGQGLPMFNKDEIEKIIGLSDWIILNEYEANLISEITGKPLKDIVKNLKAAVVTKGNKGSEIFVGDERIIIEPIKATKDLDPTGCGDAYRAGLIYGICHQMSWQQSGKIGSMMGSIKVASNGTQNHTFNVKEILEKI
ncbi:MAG: carbohydrate kinase family protein [Gammaproteobacteria bacterium]|jgi:adenosine kinase|nr:carbohydrate kinase family protein [Gammaproteobacteria bacterium]|tara:strand:- start:108 stop:1016 length:909 start_codon:yes stop_codon:yes gene_type:complete